MPILGGLLAVLQDAHGIVAIGVRHVPDAGDLRRVLGQHKKREWNEYRTRVTPYEIEEYLPIL